jgi:F0F1-type ATP synthase membrane subunit b/b'
LFNVVSITQTQVAAEAAVFYRLWESQRGALDLYAGARYMSIKGDLSLSLSDSGVEDVSANLSSKVIDEIVSGVKAKAAKELAAKKAQLTNQIAAQAGDVLNDLKAIGESHPGLSNAIKRSERLQQAIRNAASARIEEQLAIAQGKVAAARAAARQAVQKAEDKLASEIERALRKTIPSELSGTKDWVDPFIGVRGYYNFTNDFYAVTKADIGGFGISSDLTWQVYAALGYHLSKSTTIELGYKYMAVDYTSGGFTNDVRTSGVFLNLGLKL